LEGYTEVLSVPQTASEDNHTFLKVDQIQAEVSRRGLWIVLANEDLPASAKTQDAVRNFVQSKIPLSAILWITQCEKSICESKDMSVKIMICMADNQLE
jgi:hypothetical protein